MFLHNNVAPVRDLNNPLHLHHLQKGTIVLIMHVYPGVGEGSHVRVRSIGQHLLRTVGGQDSTKGLDVSIGQLECGALSDGVIRREEITIAYKLDQLLVILSDLRGKGRDSLNEDSLHFQTYGGSSSKRWNYNAVHCSSFFLRKRAILGHKCRMTILLTDLQQ